MQRTKKTMLYLITILILIIIIGTFTVHFLENWTLIDSFYWSVMTITTIGDTAHVPILNVSKLFIIVYVIIGVSTALYTLLHLATYIIEKHQRDFEKLGGAVPKRVERAVKKIKRRNRL
ncbi:two pore domain potassium channel family protein [Candidatus Micrarchaeota archaeon]|nr:two pore domain potassium channel family protein [Candidatus Micrarchaeota archaeon]